ncbi:hypothetical protein D187_010130 [Cystobacter fuscus DSM 2262]|uniref:Uncharacterized protein n=1 Tax=Cystobacter fuscus (strain ATCC 25194 / DSM 2262 / NBRC 100088 / M29) TaxID=1242864 RepID=S9PEP2_CYSF2|nr:hypothetical protein D187_010130 [Cystobacter fuscus DSM 2262]
MFDVRAACLVRLSGVLLLCYRDRAFEKALEWDGLVHGFP